MFYIIVFERRLHQNMRAATEILHRLNFELFLFFYPHVVEPAC